MGEYEGAEYDRPLQVAAGTPGNHRFGALLKSLRERSGLSPQQLAEQAGVHVSFVRGIERGAQAPSVATARALLACLEGQDRIRWLDGGPYDLLIRDPETERDVTFEFTAKVKGQNRRALLDSAAVSFSLIKEYPELAASATAALGALILRKKVDPAMLGVAASIALDAAKLRTGASRAEAVDEKPRPSAPADDERLRRVMLLLAVADEELLARVEYLLRQELEPGAATGP